MGVNIGPARVAVRGSGRDRAQSVATLNAHTKSQLAEPPPPPPLLISAEAVVTVTEPCALLFEVSVSSSLEERVIV